MPFYDMPLYRPPSEANNLILQVTLGCSFNQCGFCSMYRGKAFRVRPLTEVCNEIMAIARDDPGVRRVFLADGDALVCEVEYLLKILHLCRQVFPELTRVTAYALPSNLLRKSVADLRRLRESGLSMVYYGIESGSARMLRRITKGATPESMVKGLEKAQAAGIKVSATVILGLGGRHCWREHVEGTVALINRVPLRFLSTLQLHLAADARDDFMRKFQRFGDRFSPQDEAGMLAEQRALIAGIAPPAPIVFRSNHASNAVPLGGVLPKDRSALLASLDQARATGAGLRPAWLRGL